MELSQCRKIVGERKRSTLDIRDLQITNVGMIKPQDILVVCKLAALSGREPMSFAALGEALSMSASEVFAATRRATACRLLTEQPAPATGAGRFRPVAPNLREFLVSGLRYVFPGEIGKAMRGFRTAQDAPPLDSQIVRPTGELPIVWPHHDGDTRGLSLKPLYRSVPEAARRDSRLYSWLSLADGLRTGDARVRTVAAAEIGKLIAELDYGRAR